MGGVKILYTTFGRNPTFFPEDKIRDLVGRIQKQMNLGESVTTVGDAHHEFYYSGSPIGFANVMRWRIRGEEFQGVRLIAPDKPSLRTLTESLGVPYEKARVQN